MAACESDLNAPLVHRLFCKRHSFGPYLVRLKDRMERSGSFAFATLVAQSILTHTTAP